MVTTGSTFDNAENLSDQALDYLREQYEGTRLGRQELFAEILDDAAGALWKRDDIDGRRVLSAPPMQRVVVAIDPAATSKESSDETGIVVAGVDRGGRGYILADYSGRYTPDGWAKKAVWAYEEHKADRVVAEVNNGGEMIGTVLRHADPSIPYSAVHASRGKRTRAEPIAALYEQGKVSHVGTFALLEDQLCTWDASDGSASPDRLDALVWALSSLMRPSAPDAYGKVMRFQGMMPKRRM